MLLSLAAWHIHDQKKRRRQQNPQKRVNLERVVPSNECWRHFDWSFGIVSVVGVSVPSKFHPIDVYDECFSRSEVVVVRHQTEADHSFCADSDSDWAHLLLRLIVVAVEFVQIWLE